MGADPTLALVLAETTRAEKSSRKTVAQSELWPPALDHGLQSLDPRLCALEALVLGLYTLQLGRVSCLFLRWYRPGRSSEKLSGTRVLASGNRVCERGDWLICEAGRPDRLLLRRSFTLTEKNRVARLGSARRTFVVGLIVLFNTTFTVVACS